MVKITKLNFQNLVFFICQKSIFRRYCIQNVKDGIQIQVYNFNNESVDHFKQFISVKVKKISGSISRKVNKMEAQAKSRFPYKKACIF